jgi:tRNA threonylcarbamoyladenosine biosynthesis protein TsaE
MAEKAPAPITVELADEQATAALARRIAATARVGDVVTLSGGLGTGKTVFARAFINARLGKPEEVPSPTFTLVQAYETPGDAKAGGDGVTVYHFDLFRLQSAAEARELGMDDAFAEGISLIEWPERLDGTLPEDRLEISFAQGAAPDSRLASIVARGSWRTRVAAIAAMDSDRG